MKYKSAEELQKEVDRLEKKLEEKKQEKEYTKDAKIWIEIFLRDEFIKKFTFTYDIKETKLYLQQIYRKDDIIKKLVKEAPKSREMTSEQVALIANKLYYKTLDQVFTEQAKNLEYYRYMNEKEEEKQEVLKRRREAQALIEQFENIDIKKIERQNEQQKKEYIKKLEKNQGKFLRVIGLLILLFLYIAFVVGWFWFMGKIDYAIDHLKIKDPTSQMIITNITTKT